MKRAMLLLLLATSSVHAAEPGKWFACESSDDCIIAKGPCGEPIAVNRGFRGPFEKKSKRVACKDSFDFKTARKTKGPACGLDNKCIAVERK